MTDSNRLNAIEEELATIREATLAFIRVSNSNHEMIEQLAAGQRRTDEAIEQLKIGQQQLAQTMAQFAANAEADRAEIRRIWEYLLEQRSNGHGRS